MRELFEVVNHSKAFNYIFETKDNKTNAFDKFIYKKMDERF
jgi:hypothetical protein